MDLCIFYCILFCVANVALFLIGFVCLLGSFFLSCYFFCHHHLSQSTRRSCASPQSCHIIIIPQSIYAATVVVVCVVCLPQTIHFFLCFLGTHTRTRPFCRGTTCATARLCSLPTLSAHWTQSCRGWRTTSRSSLWVQRVSCSSTASTHHSPPPQPLTTTPHHQCTASSTTTHHSPPSVHCLQHDHSPLTTISSLPPARPLTTHHHQCTASSSSTHHTPHTATTTGCGKQTILRHAFSCVNAAVAMVHCNAQTSPSDVQDKIAQCCAVFNSNAGRVYRPKTGDSLILCVSNTSNPSHTLFAFSFNPTHSLPISCTLFQSLALSSNAVHPHTTVRFSSAQTPSLLPLHSHRLTSTLCMMTT